MGKSNFFELPPFVPSLPYIFSTSSFLKSQYNLSSAKGQRALVRSEKVAERNLIFQQFGILIGNRSDVRCERTVRRGPAGRKTDKSGGKWRSWGDISYLRDAGEMMNAPEDQRDGTPCHLSPRMREKMLLPGSVVELCRPRGHRAKVHESKFRQKYSYRHRDL